MNRLNKKNIVLIGAATGIGNRAAQMLSAEGANLVVGDVNMSGIETLVEQVRANGSEISGFHVDLAVESSVRNFIQTAHKQLGSIDGLYLNAASVDVESMANDTDIVNMDIAHWDRMMTINLRGYLLAARYAIPLMIEQGGGSILCTSSELSFVATGCKEIPAYCMSKAGVNVLVCHIASQFWRQGIRCNGIAPGYINVGRASKSREKYGALICVPELGVPDDIGHAAIHLLSDESKYIQGQMISVNGGSLFR